MNLKSIPASERPRERMARHGVEALSSIELIAILLGHGTQHRSVLELAGDLLAHFGSLQALSDSSLEELKQVKGIGTAKAIQLKAAFALFNRIEKKGIDPVLDTAEKVYHLIRSEMVSQKVEILMVILRNVRRMCIHKEIVAKGTLTELLIHPREIFHNAIRHRAHSVIIAHNHPSGDPKPSKPDEEITRILSQASKVVGIELTDHLIIGSDRYYSFYEQGLLGNRY